MNTNTQAPLTAATAGEQINKLQATLGEAEMVARVLLADPHFRNCPFVAAIRGPIVAGIDRIEHLTGWLEGNPVPAPAQPK